MVSLFELGRTGLSEETCLRVRRVFEVLGGFDSEELDDYVHGRREALRGSPIISGMPTS
jgi:hypothetical protein